MNRSVTMAAVLVATGLLALGGCCGLPPMPPIFACKIDRPEVFPKISLEKEAPPKAEVGQEFAYTIKVSNPGTVITPSAFLADVLPEGIQYISSSPEATVDGQKLSWKLGDLPVKEVRTVTIRVKATRPGKFCNVAGVTAEIGLKRDAKACTVVSQAGLSLTKTAPGETMICEPIAYKMVVTNTGDAPARNVKFADALPEGLTSEGIEAVQKDLGTLKPGESRTIAFEARASKPGTYVNKAVATAEGGFKADAEARTVVSQPALTLAKKAPARSYPNRDITYEITVTNAGDVAAQGVTLTDAIPEGGSFVSASDGGKAAGGKVVWALGDLPVKESKTVTLKLRAAGLGVLNNTAQVTARCAKASAEAQVQIVGIPAILLENWDDPDPIEVGAQTTYTVRVTNQGSAEDKGVVVACLLPAEEGFVSAQGPTAHAVDGQKVTFAPVKSLAPKEAIVYKVVVKGLKVGDVRFKVELTSDMMTTPAEKSESTHIYE